MFYTIINGKIQGHLEIIALDRDENQINWTGRRFFLTLLTPIPSFQEVSKKLKRRKGVTFSQSRLAEHKNWQVFYQFSMSPFNHQVPYAH